MSLEQTLARTNTLLEQLISKLSAPVAAAPVAAAPVAATPVAAAPVAATPVAAAPVAAAPVAAAPVAAAPVAAAPVVAALDTPKRRGRPPKNPVAVAPVVAAPVAAAPITTQPGETTYWAIDRYKTVYEQKPDSPPVNIEGARQVTKEEFDTLKAAIHASVGFAAAPVAAAPVAVESVADEPVAVEPVAVEPVAVEPVAVEWDEVYRAIVAVHTSAFPGLGTDGVRKILATFLPDAQRPRVSDLTALNRNAAIRDYATTLLELHTPKVGAVEETDDFLI